MTKSTKSQQPVADICFYGTSQIGSGYIAATRDGQMFGTGEPVADRSFTEALWLGLDDLRRVGVSAGLVRIFAPGGSRMAVVDIRDACVTFGSLAWGPAAVYEISGATLEAGR